MDTEGGTCYKCWDLYKVVSGFLSMFQIQLIGRGMLTRSRSPIS